MATSMTYIYSQGQHGQLLPYMAALHASCILVDHTVGPFLPPLTNDKLLPWWKQRIAEANQGTRVIVLLLPETAKPEGADLRGLAMLKLCETETGAFRGHIDAVLVGSKYRRQGGAKALVTALEYEAAKRGRTLLLADAETGTIAEAAFKKFGYVEIGKVPAFSQTLSSNKKGQTFFYKDLLPAASP